MAKEKKDGLTPMMRQYYATKEKLPPNTLLLFRLGDFYEMFEDDAEMGARLLGITLTKRNGTPMAGIPYHAAQNYINKALKAGKKIAICEQTETPQPGKLVERKLTRILSPGTTLESTQLEDKENHYILALDNNKKGFHASWLDLSTGGFTIATSISASDIIPLVNALCPKEIILPEGAFKNWSKSLQFKSWHSAISYASETAPYSELPVFVFETQQGLKEITQCLGVLHLDGFGIAQDHPALGVAGALIYYATENLCSLPQNIRRIQEHKVQQSLQIDPASLRSLEIFKSTAGTRENSLIEALDATVTPAGARLLEQYLSTPLLELEEIQRRNHCVAELMRYPTELSALRTSLQNTRDIVRILGRLQNKLRNPRELGGIKDTLLQLPGIKKILSSFEGKYIQGINRNIQTFDDLKETLNAALQSELPNNLLEGGYIKSDFDTELNRLRSLSQDQKTWLSNLESAEQEKTGIRNLKIKYNNAFGYFIEITKSNTHLAPDHYIRKQTMTNAERYYTQELKEKEKEILHAEEKSIALEQQIFAQIVDSILTKAGELTLVAEKLAEIDLFSGWAHLARTWNYCCPTLDSSQTLYINQGRHPVIEQKLHEDNRTFANNESFVPNDTELDSSSTQIALITGPNMAGKSTYIRQVAVITLMAQIGSWVPATQCHVGLVDRIFSRVGASDELARGNSTFMVEMSETANILNNATERSLVILDEIGRGTSTYDGLSIAWAVLEYLHSNNARGPKTLFATHYHELTQLEQHLPRLSNYTVSVKEWNDSIIFTRQVMPGAADRSYGIHVARLAGLPNSVIERSQAILEKLESKDTTISDTDKKTNDPKRNIFRAPPKVDINQLELFGSIDG